mmetsp:Transcript_15953/g.37025  ORF Transcript_15953/g.37025 Transcript_15953/m.37025 type:complete len:196 (+) Transcript_15953:107-694(+)
MGCCRDFCSSIFRCWILLCNLLDSVVGLTLVGYSIWFTDNVGTSVQYNHLASLFWMLPLTIGVVLVVSAGLSLTGMVFEDSCKCALGLSALLSMPLALLMLVTGTLMFIHRDEYFDYLEDRAGSDETSTESLETWYNVLAAGFFVTALLQIFRCLASRKLLFFVKLDASELRAAFLEDSSEYARRQVKPGNRRSI